MKYEDIAMLAVCVIAIIIYIAMPRNNMVVNRVIDGDTVVVRDGDTFTTVRIAGINTPEVGDCYASQATDFAERQLLYNQVTLDKIAKDKYGRTVAHISVGGTNYGERAIQQGYADAMLVQPHKYEALYYELEYQAYNGGAGKWRECYQITI